MKCVELTLIAGMTNISTLDFSFNNISGTVPSYFPYLTNLTYLDLQSNPLTGCTPDTSLMTSLSYFSISNTLFTGVPLMSKILSKFYLVKFENNILGAPEPMPFAVGNTEGVNSCLPVVKSVQSPPTSGGEFWMIVGWCWKFQEMSWWRESTSDFLTRITAF